jgi:N-acyl-D-amino-acid deacylase
MHDTIIRGGHVVDGLGAAPYSADIAVKDGHIVEIGKVTAPARETIDADGALVTPGFIDIHTHYDGQFLWDDTIDPSFSNGVTTAIAGNCGVGFAPAREEHRRELLEYMEGVEDIPGIVLDEGLDWEWRSFPDYMNRLAARHFGLDVASNITHAPLRVFVMGERALNHEAATREDIEKMCGLVREAMAAGAMGVSAARVLEHRSSRGANIPGTFAEKEELLALSASMGECGHGVFQIAAKGQIGSYLMDNGGRDKRIEEHEFLASLARVSGRPVTFGLSEFPSDPEDIHMMAEATANDVAAGLGIYPQVLPRGNGQISLLDGYHVFLLKPSYNAIAHLPLSDRIEVMRDPARRAAILSEADDDSICADTPFVPPAIRHLRQTLANSFILRSALDCEPGPDRRIGALAAAAGKTPEEFVYDHYAAAKENFSVTLVMNYVGGDLDAVHSLLTRPHVLSGLADGGAHMRMICDAAMPTFQLAFWSRDRSRGERLPLAVNVQKLTSAPAKLYALHDRGVLAPGKRADINVIDFARLTPKTPYMAHDLPSGGPRLLQGSEGYVATLLAGVTTRRHDKDTGARPGRLLRSSQAA